MAKRKPVSSSRPDSGESNTGLVVTLVLFILLTIGLGVTTWLGYSGKSEAEAKASQADQKAAAETKKAQEEEALKATLRIALGSDTEADRTLFSGRKSTNSAKIIEQVAGLRAFQAAPQYRWDINSAANRPPKNYTDLLAEAQQAALAKEREAKAAENTLAETRKQFDAERQELVAKQKETEKKLGEANNTVNQVRQEKHGGSDEASKKIKELTDQVAQLTIELQNTKVEKDRDIAKRDAEIENRKKIRDALFAKVGPLMDKLASVAESRPEMRDIAELHEMLARVFDKSGSLTNDTPKGEVVKVDRANNRDLVYVNLGSADYLQPQVSFSIMPAGSTGKAASARQRKAAIEIVTILEPHLSTAKIVEEPNRYRDPIMPGDLLFNPVWNRDQRVHIALCGMIDINGDGIDDTPELIKMLEKQGVIIDAWLDPRAHQIKGPGITERTEFLVLGEAPKLSEAMMATEGNTIAESAKAVLARMEEMKAKAKEMGVTQTQYKKYLSLSGFKLPKNPAELNASSYLRGTGSIKPPDSEERPK
ncbi:MAG TPA: hypothetical protein VL371_00160 [Gemmataceae bacterium]|jgi:hypothetical protein|nr:hypothetical protein [Gemmataceae bacterium]